MDNVGSKFMQIVKLSLYGTVLFKTQYRYIINWWNMWKCEDMGFVEESRPNHLK